jgi:alpha-glucosidase
LFGKSPLTMACIFRAAFISAQLIALLAAFPTLRAATETTVASPDNAVSLRVNVADQQLTLSATFKGQPVLDPSPLKMLLDGAEISRDVALGEATRGEVHETFATRGWHNEARIHGNTLSVALAHQKTNTRYTLELRAYNDGVAFRLVIPESGGAARAPDEKTVFTVPAASTVWYHDLYWHYEGIHAKKDAAEISAGEWAAPPLTFKLPNGAGYAVITEAGLHDYAGMALQADGKRGFIARLGHAQPAGYPFAVDYKMEDAKRLAIPATFTGKIVTPWRVVIVGSDLNTLVNCDLLAHLSPPPDPKLFPHDLNTAWVKPGRAVWPWIDGGERTVEGMKEFSRLAGELGFEYNVVDAYWHRWTDEQIRGLVDYSKERGVAVWLWRHGRDVRDPEKRRAFFKRCQDLGVVGVKLDAFSNESKEFIDLYQACLRDAAEFNLMLNIHGSNKPTGESRTWPNEMTREGIRGLEYSGSANEHARHDATLPFTRLVAGHGDATPMIFTERRRDTTWPHQIATAVLFTSPVLIYAAHPQKILDNPAVEMIKSIPSVWDETIVLPCSDIGEVAAFARRRGDIWFLAVVNGPEARSFQVPLTFLGEGFYWASVVCDRLTDPADVKQEKAYAQATDSFPINMLPGGGYIARFTKTEPPPLPRRRPAAAQPANVNAAPATPAPQAP